MRSSAILMLVLCFALGVGDARAQTSGDDERARIHFESAREYFADGDYENALRQFEHAHELSGRPGLLYNIYLSHERLGQHGPAADALERFLASGEETTERERLEARLLHLRQRAEAERAEAAPEAPHEAAVAEEDQGTAAEPPRLSPPPPEEPAGPPTASLVAWGVGAAGLVTFAIFGPLTLAEDASLAESCGADAGRTCGDGDLSTLSTYAAIADVGWIVALAGGITGAALWLLTGDAAGEEEAPSVTAALRPWASEAGAGAVMTGWF